VACRRQLLLVAWPRFACNLRPTLATLVLAKKKPYDRLDDVPYKLLYQAQWFGRDFVVTDFFNPECPRVGAILNKISSDGAFATRDVEPLCWVQ